MAANTAVPKGVHARLLRVAVVAVIAEARELTRLRTKVIESFGLVHLILQLEGRLHLGR